ncbi:uncharacterized protein LOC135171219 [Diachasmimorpha longicaudata]|uniref:uncharacterized protein LOC135171219 n=1 Tax=Diachasmimorpha longicaudata TaxID=58733 RepID=UPI0030B90215
MFNIQLQQINNTKLFIVSVYATTKIDSKQVFLDELNTGDCNARHQNLGDYRNNARGTYLSDWNNRLGIQYRTRIYHGNTPTCLHRGTFPDRGIIDSRLDITYAQGIAVPTLIFDSDHKALFFRVNLSNIGVITPKDPAPPRFNYKETNWEEFNKFLDNNYDITIPINRNLNITEIDNFIQQISSKINEAIGHSSPIFQPQDSIKKYLNRKILKLQKHKSKLLTLWHKKLETDPKGKKTWTRQIKKTLDAIRNQLQQEYNLAVERNCQNIFKKIDLREFHRFMPTINKIFRPKNNPEIPNLHIKNSNQHILLRSECNLNEVLIANDETIISKPADKLNIIGSDFETINAPRHLNTETRLRELILMKINDFKETFITERENNTAIIQFSDHNKASSPPRNLDLETSSYFCSLRQVAIIIKHLPNKTSFGIDKIPNIILKRLPTKVITDYPILFNNSLNLSCFPTAWKTAKVIPLLKNNKPSNEPASYRPMSLTPTISKVFESIISTTNITYCNKLKIIPDTQFGFRRSHSTTHAIHKLLSDVNHEISQNNLVGAALIDLEKAFDTVWHDGLIYKLIKKKFQTHLIKMIWDLIKDKRFFISGADENSTITFNIKDGLQQGTVNSPILFNIFTADIINSFDMNQPNSNKFSIAYADDLIIYISGAKAATISRDLETLVNKINNLYSMWNLKMNPNKCETILFRKPYRFLPGNRTKGITSFKISTSCPVTREIIELPHRNEVTYLGMKIDNLIRNNKHTYTQQLKASNRFKSLSRLFHNKNITKTSRLICYLILVRPLLTYASPIWWNIGSRVMERTRRLERRCIRAGLRLYRNENSGFTKKISNKQLYNTAKIQRIDNFILRLTRDYYKNLKTIKNEALEKLSTVDPIQTTIASHSGYFPPQAFTFFDRISLIQNEDNIPLIYHYDRNSTNKKLPIATDATAKLKYSMAIPEVDFNDTQRIDANYWWVDDTANFHRELARKKEKNLEKAKRQQKEKGRIPRKRRPR